MRSTYLTRTGAKRPKSRFTKPDLFIPEKAPSIETLDDRAAAIVKARYDYECQLSFYDTGIECGGCLDAHHVFRKRFAVRYDLRVLLPVCRVHHTWAHSHTKNAEALFRKILGDALYDEAYRLSKTTVHDTLEQRSEWSKQLRGGE